ncbi:cation diffusion facilitator family transporter [Paenibacillus sinopodophylli]|uniref:cation diffusion facilitator family transporter n=1 Tax=Paenibacillus sinopodophylli TaxID=1837342 RepID=UPI00110CFC54|nr:cation diffusion facilitator family transporter [Paenibacillus sinopodophylli]
MSKSSDDELEKKAGTATNKHEKDLHTHDHKNGSCSHSHDEHDHHEVKNRKHSHAGHSHGGHHHGHHHGHSHGHHGHSHAPNNKAGLLIALIITAGIMVLEFVGGLVTNSLALLSDSGHMLSDTAALALSLAAMWFAVRPRSSSRTYGFHRFEILAALLNGVTLFVIAAFIVVEAIKRFGDPPSVASGTMMIIAGIGLLANLASAWFLMRKADVKDNLNVRSAYLHVIGDAIGSVGAIIAGILMSLFSWYIADPIISVVVALLILKSAWGIIKSTVHILMEGTPANVDAEQVEEMLRQIPGVTDVHDLHIWTITSGLDSLSCHLKVEDSVDSQKVLQQAISQIAVEFQIEHATIQIEKSELKHSECKV